MEPRISIITLGVKDLPRARHFYEHGLGWSVSSVSNENIVFMKIVGTILALYPADYLAEDANVEGAPSQGFRQFTLAHNVRERHQVAEILQQAVKAGGKITKPAQDTPWGGYSGYFADPDGYLWEVAWNPHFQFNPEGTLSIPN